MLKTCLIWLGVLVLLCACEPPAPAEYADTVFINGDVYTANPEQPWAKAVAISDGRIRFVGDSDTAGALVGPDSDVHDLAGKMLMPGFIDSHMHPMAAGTRFLRCDLEGLAWPDQVRDKIIECAATVKPGQWLRGINLDSALMEAGVLHTDQLDEWTGSAPAFIASGAGWMVWVDSQVLELAGIDADTPDPEKGTIVRDKETGKPTGELHYSAANSAYSRIPVPGLKDLLFSFRKASEMANSFGITTSSEASMSAEHYSAFVAVEAAGNMTLRVFASQRIAEQEGPGQVQSLVNRRDETRGGMFRANSAKLFLDGSGNRTGAMLQPYVGTDDDYGELAYSDEKLRTIVQELDAEGMQVHMHAYGDAAVRQGLDALSELEAVNGPGDRRHVLAHLALIEEEDLSRFAELGVTANISPLWACMDDYRAREIADLGEKRGERLLAFRDLFESGARVTAGSDWISASMNPLYSIQVALTRVCPGSDREPWLPGQRVTLEQMLKAYTINGAWQFGAEHEIGSIEVGKQADLVVLEQNLFNVDSSELVNVQVVMTMLEGSEVFSRDNP